MPADESLTHSMVYTSYNTVVALDRVASKYDNYNILQQH